MAEHTLEARLVGLGEAMVFPAADRLADDVMQTIGSVAPIAAGRAPGAGWRRPMLVAAAVVIAVALAMAMVPDARRAVARWLGFESYRIEPVLELPDISDVPPAGAAPGPGEVLAETTVDGTPVVIVALPGELREVMFRKLVGPGTTITETMVGGGPAYWIAGSDHVLMYIGADGAPVEARMSSNALVWQRGDQILRVEGAITLDQALEVAAREG